MKNKAKFIEDFLGKNGYGIIMSGDHDPNPSITYFHTGIDKISPIGRHYSYLINEKKYWDFIAGISYTPAQFVRYIKRIDSLISFW